MGLKSESLPNKRLLGTEVRAIAVKQFDEMLSRDYAFMHTAAYGRVAISFSVTFHLGKPHEPHVVRSYTKPDDLIAGEVPLTEVLCKCGHTESLHFEKGCVAGDVGVEACDCKTYVPDAVLVSLERDITLDNPNLARVHHDLPIKVTDRKPPREMPYNTPLPGEPPPPFMLDPYPQMETKEIRYDSKDFPPMEPPVDRDVSDTKAEQLGLKKRSSFKERKA